MEAFLSPVAAIISATGNPSAVISCTVRLISVEKYSAVIRSLRARRIVVFSSSATDRSDGSDDSRSSRSSYGSSKRLTALLISCFMESAGFDVFFLGLDILFLSQVNNVPFLECIFTSEEC